LFTISWIHLTILALASFRLTHLLVYDDITSFLRKPFLSVTYTTDQNGAISQQIEIKGKGLRYGIGSVLSCHWCTGMWSSIAVVALYVYAQVLFPLLIILAIAGIAAIIETWLLK
jgi:hypothetical protein